MMSDLMINDQDEATEEEENEIEDSEDNDEEMFYFKQPRFISKNLTNLDMT